MPGRRVYFRLMAPEAETVVLLGSFNDWNPAGRPLKRGKGGVWRTHITLWPGTYEYRFLVDGAWRNDPEAEVVANPYGSHNSVRVVTA